MANVMKRISVVVLLSTALVSGQDTASVPRTAQPQGLSDTMQKLRGQWRKVFESKKTVNYALLAAGLGAAGLGISGVSGLLEHTLVQVLFPLTGGSFLVLGKAIDANFTKRHYVAGKAAGEAYRHGENRGSYRVIRTLAEANPEHEPVEVNDRIDMLLKIFMWVQPPSVVNMFHIDALIAEKDGFPLTVSREGVTFNNGVFASYEELFGEGNFRHRTREETSEEVLDAADD